MSDSPTPQPSAPVDKSGRAFWLGVLLIGILLTTIVLLLNLRTAVLNQNAPTPTLPSDANGIFFVDDERELLDFTLPANTGEEISLESLTTDRYTLLFFGYTHCPDFCPLTLTKFRQIKRELGEQADLINFVFVSVDGVRDTPEVLDTYVTRFDEAFIGLSGTDDTLLRVAPDYGLYYQLNTDEGENYTVDHGTSTYLIDRDRELRVIYTFSAETSEMVTSIRTVFAEDGV